MPKSTGQEELLAKFVKVFDELTVEDLKPLISDYFQESDAEYGVSQQGADSSPLYAEIHELNEPLYDDVAPKVLDFYRELEELIEKSPHLAMINSFDNGSKADAIVKVSKALLAQRYNSYEFGDSGIDPHNSIATLMTNETPDKELVSELESLDFHEIENQQFEALPADDNYMQPVGVNTGGIADGIYYSGPFDNSVNGARSAVYEYEVEGSYDLASSATETDVAIAAVKKAFNALLATYPENQQFSDLGLQIANSENVSIVAKKDLDGKYKLEINQGRLSSPGLESRSPSPDSGISLPEPVSFGPGGNRSSSPSNTSMDSLSSIGSGYIEIAGDNVSVSGEDVDLVQVSQALHSATKRREGSRAPSPEIAPGTTSQIIGGRDRSGRE